MAIRLSKHQLRAIDMMKTGSILCGGVGSGKSRAALAYYLLKDCKGNIAIDDDNNIFGQYAPMKEPKDLYIITTAKKRDSLEWDKECAEFVLGKDQDTNAYDVEVTVDSWNNIKKYKDIYGAFFIFDEQRVVGSGAWVKAFLNIARKNHWVLLSATPGDQWKDYIPVFIANGFFKNKTEFNAKHCVFSRFSKYPKIERYIGERTLMKYRDSILVPMKDDRDTHRHRITCSVDYDKLAYRAIFRDRWDPWEHEPIQETGKLMYLLRKLVNGDISRLDTILSIIEENPKVIIFYNYTYELEAMRKQFNLMNYPYAEWNGQKHEVLPTGKRWAYLVQYSAGCEGWNCVTTDVIIFYSQNYSYRIMEQACGRIDRTNTPYRDLYYYVLISSAPIDLAIQRALRNKKNFNERSFLSKK